MGTHSECTVERWRRTGVTYRSVRSHRAESRFDRVPTGAVAVLVTAALGFALALLTAPRPSTEDGMTVPLAEPDRERQEAARASRAGRGAGEIAASTEPTRWAGPTHSPVTRISRCFDTAHRGVDISAPPTHVARAAGAGRVVRAEQPSVERSGRVVVDHEDGWMTAYDGLAFVFAEPAQRVFAGTPVGQVGGVGHVAGSHVHLAVARTHDVERIGVSLVDPVPWLRERGIATVGCRT